MVTMENEFSVGLSRREASDEASSLSKAESSGSEKDERNEVKLSVGKLLNIIKADKDLSAVERERTIKKLLLSNRGISSQSLNESERRILIAPFNYSL